ncbi:MAG: hypothetical protein ABR503_03180 [Chitinophagaceae bacterium]|nr:hypothetical protein [Chitinophagaceae bacterium]
MKQYLFFCIAIVTIFTQCDSLKNLPTNTSGGLFSLNGSWQLAGTNDNRAMEGTVVSVVPGVADATVRTLANNTYCARERDVLWRNLKSGEGGIFSLDNMVFACTGNPVYQQATLTVLTNDEVRITSRTNAGLELIQTWRRVPN